MRVQAVLKQLPILAIAILGACLHGEQSAELIVPDGQLISHAYRVFIQGADVTEAMKPRLIVHRRYIASNDTTTRSEGRQWTPYFVSPNQTMDLVVSGTKVSVSGTLLLFDLREVRLEWYQAMFRITPHLDWVQDGQQHSVVTEGPIYVGKLYIAIAWAACIGLILILFIAVLSKRGSGRYLAVLQNDQGNLSLSNLQMCLWTLAVGGVVCIFGLIQLKIPDIPQTLVLLMGLSVITSSLADRKNDVTGQTEGGEQAADPAGQATQNETSGQAADGGGKEAQAAVYAVQPKPVSTGPVKPKLEDLICIADGQHGKAVSLPKAQMLFWTVINVGFFTAKSIIDGVMWEVPIEMVYLMGISQAGYVVPGMMQKK